MKWFLNLCKEITAELFRRADYYENEIPPEVVMEPIIMDKSTTLYNTAKACLGLDMVDDPTVDPSVGCAVSVNAVFKKAFGSPVGGGASTADMYHVLKTDSRFTQILQPIPGCIVISPTGTSIKGAPHGHVGIEGYHGRMSNNSLNGLWSEVYTDSSWSAYYEVKLGFPTYYFSVNN